MKCLNSCQGTGTGKWAAGILLTLFLWFGPCGYAGAVPGSYAKGHVQYTLTDGSRNNRKIPLEIFYPSLLEGENTPVAAGTFPLIVFGHGFMMKWSSYTNFADSLVTRGYVLVFTVTETSLLPSNTDFAKDLAFTASSFFTENENPGSVFYHKLTKKCAVAGHSMGGGCAMIASQYTSVFAGYVLIAPLNITPGTTEQAKKTGVPLLIYGGTKDCITPPAQNQQPIYDASASVSKTCLLIGGGTHCQFAESDSYCRTGEILCLEKSIISFAGQQQIVFKTLIPWLDYVLKDMQSEAVVFQQAIHSEIKLDVQQNIPLAAPVQQGTNTGFLKIYPNPAGSIAYLVSERVPLNGEYVIYNLQGMAVQTGKLSGDKQSGLQIDLLEKGIYFVRLKMEGIQPDYFKPLVLNKL